MKGIIFSDPMVRALLEGRKTQTRRVARLNAAGRVARAGKNWHPDDPDAVLACPYGRVGDRLYVKEAWKYADWTDDGHPLIEYRSGGDQWREDVPEDWSDRVLDIWATLSDPENYAIDARAADRRWRSPLHMPCWASRSTLELTATRIERLQDIAGADAIAEGIQCPAPTVTPADHAHDCVCAYRDLWDSIHGPDSWAANPYVWVLTFRRIEG